MEFLHRSRASFLFLAGRVEELARIAQEGQLGESGPGSLDAAERAVYQRALAAVHEEMGNLEAAVRVFDALQGNGDGLSKPEQLHLADCYIRMGRDADAAGVLRKFRLKEGDPNTDAVLRRLGGIYARQRVEGAGELRRLAIQAGRLAASMEACIELAGYLAEAGLADVADALLELRARRTTQPGARFAAGRQRIALRQSAATAADGKVRPLDPGLLTGWMRSWGGSVEQGEAILALAESAPEAHRTAWRTAREILATEPGTRFLASLLRLSDGEEAGIVAEAVGATVASEPSPTVRLAAQVLSRHGQPDVARRWMMEVHRRREVNPAEDTALMLRICQAGEDAAGMREWRDRLARFAGSHSQFIDFAAEFFRVGQPEMALDLMGRRYQSFRVLTEEQRYFLNEYARHLIREWRLEEADKVLLAMFQKTLGGNHSLLVDYYRAAGKLDRLAGELDKYYLSTSERERVLSLIPTAIAPRRPGTSAIR
jgi:hypothetical protein